MHKKYRDKYSISTIFYSLDKFEEVGYLRKSQVHEKGIAMIEFPRIFIDELSDYSELGDQGIYLLIRNNKIPYGIYVGKSENLYRRISEHHNQKIKDFNYVVAFCLKDEASTIGIADYLEYYYINKLKSQNYYGSINSIPRSEPKINEYNKTKINKVIENIDRLLNLININFDYSVDQINNNEWSTKNESEKLNVFKYKDAQLIYKDNNWIMLKGSQILAKPLAINHINAENKEKNEQKYLSFCNSFNNLIKSFNTSLSLSKDGSYYELKDDINISSCSTAASLVAGRTSNGWVCWINDDEQTLDQVYRNKETSK